MEPENVCCPMFGIVDCADTDKHKHLFCMSHHTLEDCVMSNDHAREFCLGSFTDCAYYPRGEDGDSGVVT